MKEVFYLGTLILQLFLIKLKPLLHEVWILLKKKKRERGWGVEGIWSVVLPDYIAGTQTFDK